MMWHTREHRVLAPEESPTMEHAEDFLAAHADVVLYSGQDMACACKPSLGHHAPDTACTPCAELSPVVDGASLLGHAGQARSLAAALCGGTPARAH